MVAVVVIIVVARTVNVDHEVAPFSAYLILTIL
jgi:hypothetical protein